MELPKALGRQSMLLSTHSRDDQSERAPSASEKIWIVLAAYNEELRLAATLDDVCQNYRNVVVVDDGSWDATSAVALRYPVWVLRHIINCGQGAALQTGITFALDNGADILVTFDADGQHASEDIARLVLPIGEGRADVVLGSRFLGAAIGLPWSRWVVLKLGVLFTRCLSRLRVTDTHNGLRAFARSAAQRLVISHPGMAHASEILDQIRLNGLRYVEAPVTVRYSETTLSKGQSSWNAFKIVGQLLLGRIVR